MRIIIASILCALTLSAAGVSGKWMGTASTVRNGKKHTTGIYLTLTESGPKLTGTANEPAGNKVTPVAIANGVVQGKTVSFSATLNNTLETFDLNLVQPNLMSGKMTGGGVTYSVQMRLEK